MRIGEMYYQQKRHEQAAPLIEQGAAELRRLYGPQHPNLPKPLLVLARLKIATGDLDAAEALFREIHALPVKSNKVKNLGYTGDLTKLADLFDKRGEPARAGAIRTLMAEF
jgi:ATP/maltotriose-dependent transcriptional regulator MalT